MRCKACNNMLFESDMYPLPDGKENDLCKTCISEIRRQRSFTNHDDDLFTLENSSWLKIDQVSNDGNLGSWYDI